MEKKLAISMFGQKKNWAEKAELKIVVKRTLHQKWRKDGHKDHLLQIDQDIM